MNEEYICVVCGQSVDALYRQYGPSVIKVTTCARCGSISDKYIEYDPVIIMVDLVLLSKQAYRHVLYNTTFKAYWKLCIVLIALETYIECSNQMFHEQTKHKECVQNFNNQHSVLCDKSQIGQIDSHCISRDAKIVCQNRSSLMDRKELTNLNEDPFLTEKGVYITFCCVCLGMFVFTIAVYVISIILKPSFEHSEVSFVKMLKGLTLGGMGNLLMIPSIIWGSENDSTVHVPLVLAYTTSALMSIHSVLFKCSKMASFSILMLAFLMKVTIKGYLKTTVRYLLDFE